MKNKKTNKPADNIRDGALKATIWKNDGESGSFYTVQFSRTYTDSRGGLRDADSFSGPELLRIAHLAQKAYDRTRELRSEDSAEETQPEPVAA